MKIVSYNVNSVRKRLHHLKILTDEHQPDIIGLQETKVTDEDFPIDDIKELGYHVDFHGQKTHYGVAILSKMEPSSIEKGFPSDADDAQRRIIIGNYNLKDGTSLKVINGYFPQGESRDHPVKFPAKEVFYQDLMTYLNDNCDPENDKLVIIGDFNISPEDIDIGIGEDNRKRWLRTGKCSFLPEEREWMNRLKDWGVTDVYRSLHPDALFYSWFDYRSRGFERDPKRGLRIDLLLATKPLLDTATEADIFHKVRGLESPSDHCPAWAEFDIA